VGNLQRATEPVDAILNLGKVAVDAVFSKPVSGQISLLTGNLTGKSLNFGLFRTVFKDFTPIYFTKITSKGHFPVIQITGKKKFASGKEIIKTGKRGSRIGKFISGKIYADFENIVICLVGYYSPISRHLIVLQ
jgi:hypothetical protein